MQQTTRGRPVAAPVVLGAVLILIGSAALLLRAANINLVGSVGPWGWPLFIIVPGLVLLGASLLPERPTGIWLAVSGAIVTTIGALLLYQWRTDHFESWAYAWALLPAAAGLALVAYGTYAGERGMVNRGLRLATVAGLLFVAGAWFFEGLFAGDQRPQAGEVWPIALIVLGGFVALRALVSGPDRAGPGSPPDGKDTSTDTDPA